YGSSNTIGATWAGDHGLHFVANGPTAHAKVNIAAYKAALAKRGGVASAKPEFGGGAAVGLLRWIFVADGDAEAQRIARPNVEYHLTSLDWLRRKHSTAEFTARDNVPRGRNFEECVADGTAIAGSPETVCRTIERQAAEPGRVRDGGSAAGSTSRRLLRDRRSLADRREPLGLDRYRRPVGFQEPVLCVLSLSRRVPAFRRLAVLESVPLWRSSKCCRPP